MDGQDSEIYKISPKFEESNDLFYKIPVIIFLMISIIVRCCCCRKKRNYSQILSPPVVVNPTAQAGANPTGEVTYPITGATYPTAGVPYPTGGTLNPMPYPTPSAPSAPDANALLPSYDQAVTKNNSH